MTPPCWILGWFFQPRKTHPGSRPEKTFRKSKIENPKLGRPFSPDFPMRILPGVYLPNIYNGAYGHKHLYIFFFVNPPPKRFPSSDLSHKMGTLMSHSSAEQASFFWGWIWWYWWKRSQTTTWDIDNLGNNGISTINLNWWVNQISEPSNSTNYPAIFSKWRSFFRDSKLTNALLILLSPCEVLLEMCFLLGGGWLVGSLRSSQKRIGT